LRKRNSRTQIIRLLIQSFFLILGLGILCFVIISGRKAIHNACPYAAVCFGLNPDTLFRLAYVLFPTAVILGLIFLISSIFWGRKFCSYICPLGTFQEGIFQLRKPKYRMKTRVPFFYERKLAKLKYLVLIITSILVIGKLAYLYIRYCPIYALSQIPFLDLGGLFVLGIIAVGAFFTERLWCRFLCPYAALLNIFQWLGGIFGIKRLKVRRNLESCIDCRICNMNCPMNIDLLESEYVNDPNCIGCGLCAEKCPKPCTVTECREES